LSKEVKKMKGRNRLAAFLIILVVFFASNPVIAERKNQGAQSKEVAFDAVFEDRAGLKHVLNQVQVRTPEGESTELETKLGDAIIHLSLAKITKVSLVDEKATPDGYVKATIAFPDGSEETYELRVQQRGEPIVLVGSTKGGKGEISLLRCKYIQFSASTPSVEQKKTEHPPTKK
jgi:hypothetical protein